MSDDELQKINKSLSEGTKRALGILTRSTYKRFGLSPNGIPVTPIPIASDHTSVLTENLVDQNESSDSLPHLANTNISVANSLESSLEKKISSTPIQTEKSKQISLKMPEDSLAAADMAQTLVNTNETLSKTQKLLADAIKVQNQRFQIKEMNNIKYFAYPVTPMPKTPNGELIETNVQLWFQSIDDKTSSDSYTDEDKCKLAIFYTLTQAKEFLDKIIIQHGYNWETVKEKFTELSLQIPENSCTLMAKIAQTKREPGESFQSLVLRLDNLGNLLAADPSYKDAVNPMMCDALANSVSPKFKASLTVEDKKSLATCLAKTLKYIREHPEEKINLASDKPIVTNITVNAKPVTNNPPPRTNGNRNFRGSYANQGTRGYSNANRGSQHNNYRGNFNDGYQGNQYGYRGYQQSFRGNSNSFRGNYRGGYQPSYRGSFHSNRGTNYPQHNPPRSHPYCTRCNTNTHDTIKCWRREAFCEKCLSYGHIRRECNYDLYGHQRNPHSSVGSMGFSGTYHMPPEPHNSSTPAIAYVSDAGQSEAAMHSGQNEMPQSDYFSTEEESARQYNCLELSKIVDEILKQKKSPI